MVGRLVDWLTAGSRLVVAGRVKPSMRLAHFRAANKLHQIGPDHLAFEPHESARLVEATGLRLTAKGIAALVE